MIVALLLLVAAGRPISEKDLFDFVWAGSPQISPDGSRVAFTRVTVDAKKTGYETSIWMVATSGREAPVRLTNGKRDASPRWSPDGKQLAFVRGGEKDEKGKPAPPQIAVLPFSGGEAFIVTDLPKGASHPVWSPDGKRIAFLSGTSPKDLERARAKAAKPAQAPETDVDHEPDAHLITRAVWRSNDQGYLDYEHPDHLWVVELPDGKPVQLTKGDFDEDEPVWAPDGRRIFFLTTRVPEPYYELPTTDVYSVPANGGDVARLTSIPMAIGDLALSPDGKRFAFHASVNEPVRSYSQPDLWVMDAAPNPKPVNLTASFDFDMGGGLILGDCAPPRGGRGRALSWTPDGRSIIDRVGRRGTTTIVRVDARSGEVTPFTRERQVVLDQSVSADGARIAALVSDPVHVGDLFAIAPDGKQTQLTDFNEKLWSQLDLTPPEEIEYASFDGRRIHAWVQKPPGFDPRRKYPLILNIHGGPHAAYGWVFDHEFQWMAAKGYVVLYPNPRGSTTYGQEFGNVIQYKYPGDDYRDLMAGVDELIRRGYVDEKKLGVTGGSGGGVLTNWTVTHTDRFAAAVSQRDISNWASWWYTADFTLFQANWFRAPPFQDPKDYADRSAITYVDRIHTPILFVLGENDSRTPPDSGGEQLFRALKFLKRPTAMVIFPRETHELSRSGEPWHRVERLEHIVGWFDKWMLGARHPEYDMPATAEKPKATR